MHSTGNAATKRLNIAEMEDLVRSGPYRTHPDPRPDHRHRCRSRRRLGPRAGSSPGARDGNAQSAHLPRMQPSHGRPLMTRSQDFDAMNAHYGYAPVCAVLSHHHVAIPSPYCLVQAKIARDAHRLLALQSRSGRSQSRSSRFTLQFRWRGAPPAAKSLGNSRIGSPGLTPSGRVDAVRGGSSFVAAHRGDQAPDAVGDGCSGNFGLRRRHGDPLRREQRLDTVQGPV
jgi:hypothetical protein